MFLISSLPDDVHNHELSDIIGVETLLGHHDEAKACFEELSGEHDMNAVSTELGCHQHLSQPTRVSHQTIVLRICPFSMVGLIRHLGLRPVMAQAHETLH